MPIDILNPAAFGLMRFLFVLEGHGLVDERNFRGLCGANGLDPDAPGIRKSVYAALAEQFLASDDDGAMGLIDLLDLAERAVERDLG
jgi:hypothetical protein